MYTAFFQFGSGTASDQVQEGYNAYFLIFSALRERSFQMDTSGEAKSESCFICCENFYL